MILSKKNKMNIKCCVILIVLPLLLSAGCNTPTPTVSEQKQSEQYGAARIDFRLGQNENAANGFIILPIKPAADGTRPWIWYAPTFIGGRPDSGLTWMFEKLLAKGFYICGIDVGESYGSPSGTQTYSALYSFVTKKYALDAKASLLPQSRGGLMLYNWAIQNADKVKCIAGIYTVCDIESYPGLKKACKSYAMTERQLLLQLHKHNPIDRLESLADADVPILHIHGDSDRVVPLSENSGKLIRRYKTLGGKAELIVVKGKGHGGNAEFFQNQKVIEFLLTQGELIFQDNFKNLDNWHFEGLVDGVTNPEPGIMRLDCSGSKLGGAGCMAFCKIDFPDNIKIEYDLFVEEKNGLVITFIGMKGIHGQDAITGVPKRKGIFDDYVSKKASTRSYHVSLSRYNDQAEHTGVSNWRRNPGLHLMAQGKDLCKQIQKWYHITVIKNGPTCKLYVDGKPAGSFTDPQTLDGEIPTSGKIGFRAIGVRAVAKISNFKVSKYGPDKK